MTPTQSLWESSSGQIFESMNWSFHVSSPARVPWSQKSSVVIRGKKYRHGCSLKTSAAYSCCLKGSSEAPVLSWGRLDSVILPGDIAHENAIANWILMIAPRCVPWPATLTIPNLSLWLLVWKPILSHVVLIRTSLQESWCWKLAQTRKLRGAFVKLHGVSQSLHKGATVHFCPVPQCCMEVHTRTC